MLPESTPAVVPANLRYTPEHAPINILIVDDEPRNLTVLETVLEDPSYRLVRAGSADEALLALIIDEFALLILDIQMPGMTGFELAQVIKERRKTADVPIIFLTAYYNEDQHVLEGYDTGAVDYLLKPVNPAILRSKVSVFAELYRKNRECGLANHALLAEVTERRRIEEQLRHLNETLERRVTERTEAVRENQLLLRHAADSAGLTYVELDFARGRVRTAENFAAVMGYVAPSHGESDIGGARLLLGHVVPEDQKRVKRALQQAADGEPASRLDFRTVGDDGIERCIESEWFIELKGDAKPRKTFLTLLDITARKAAQERLRESEQRFRQLADSMPQMVWTARSDGVLDYFNARWYEFTGFEQRSCVEISTWEPILHPDDAVHWFDTWRDSIQTGEVCRIEYRLWDRRTNQYCWYLGRALPVRNEDGSIAKWIGTCTDIDEQKRSQEGLRRANHALEQFAYAASHDLQEPLRNVAVFSQIIKKRYSGKINEEADKYLEIIVEGAHRMESLVTDLLAYAQTAALENDPAIVVDAERVFEQVLRNLESIVQESHATITHDPLPSVLVNDVHLKQLLQNIVGNALKYRKDGEAPSVHVSAMKQDREWRFVVRDNGIGIAPQYHGEVFGIFKRLHAKGGKYPGTGIGLAICQKIIERYGGRIWVESEADQGATFLFTVPAEIGTETLIDE